MNRRRLWGWVIGARHWLWEVDCLPVFPWLCLAWSVQLRFAGGTTTRPLGGECLGLTQMGNESPGQPLHWPPPPLKPPSPPSRATGGARPGSEGVAQRPSGPSGLPLAQLPSSTSRSTSWETLAALRCLSKPPRQQQGFPATKAHPGGCKLGPVLP